MRLLNDSLKNMSKLKRNCIGILVFILLIAYTQCPSPINDFYNDEFEILLNRKVISEVSIERYPRLVPVNPSNDVNCLFVSSNLLFNYFVKFKYADLDQLRENDLVVVDIHRKQKNMVEGSELFYLGHDIYFNTFKKSQISETTSIVRSLDIFGNNVVDSRMHWSSVPLKSKALAFFKLSKQELDEYLQTLTMFKNFKQNQFISLSVNPKFQNKKGNDNFKIFQLSDLHFLNGRIDSLTEIFIVNAINDEQPNLIIINGDLIDFEGKNIKINDLSTVLLNCLNLFIKFKIPYILNFGEAEYNSPNVYKLLEFISNLPYCLNSADNLDHSLNGLTNYNFKIYLNKEVVGIISTLDTKHDLVTSNQMNAIYKFNSLNQVDKIFKLAFLHFPLPNFRPVGKFEIVGTYNKVDKLETDTDRSLLKDFINLNYNVVSASHEHENDGCIIHNNNEDKSNEDNAQPQNKIWLCYSAATGLQSKSDMEMDKKFRVFEIKKNRLLSWKIREKTGAGYDYQAIHDFEQV